MAVTVGRTFKLNITSGVGPGPWTPPYTRPTSAGQVVKIAADATSTLGHGSGGSTYPTNVFADVRPPEVGSPAFGNQMLFTGDTRTKFIESYSRGGAIVIAGSGGHDGTNVYGAALFDFEDARWKRVWTTQGNPGIDNTTNSGPPPSQGGPPFVDLRSNTKTHGCLNYEADNTEWFIGTTSGSNAHSTTPCWDPAHWPSGGGGSTALQRQHCPLTADPRDQCWEISRSSPTVNAPAAHGWPYPGEFNGLQNGRFKRTGYIVPVPGGRFNPPRAGTLEPTQSEIPAPGHIWDHFYELKPEEGGGPRGSIITGNTNNQGYSGGTGCQWSHRFDLYTGIWHEFSTNPPVGPSTPVPPAGGGPTQQSSGIASAEDRVKRRVFSIGKRLSQSGGRVNYMNLFDRTWRNFAVGSGGGTPTDRTENMWVDPDRRLLVVAGDQTPWLWAVDLQTLGPEPVPSATLGGWRTIPFDDIPGVQTWNGTHNYGNTNMVWRYYPPNGKYYRVNARTGPDDDVYPRPEVPVLQRLTPPPIIPTPRPNFYYTTESMSGRWRLDEITPSIPLPAPDPNCTWAVCGFTWFHYVPSIQCLAYAPLGLGSLRVTDSAALCFSD